MDTLGATPTTTEYVTMADMLLDKPFFSANSLLPSSTFKEELYTWPAADFSNLNGGSSTLSMSRTRLVTANPQNFGWDIGSLKSTILCIIGGVRTRTSSIGVGFSDTLPSASELPDGSYLFNFEGSGPATTIYKRSGGAYTSLATDTGITAANTISQPTTGLAFYYDDSSNRLLGFLRYGVEQWIKVIDITDTSFTTMRYVSIRSFGVATVMWAICPMAIYTN